MHVAERSSPRTKVGGQARGSWLVASGSPDAAELLPGRPGHLAGLNQPVLGLEVVRRRDTDRLIPVLRGLVIQNPRLLHVSLPLGPRALVVIYHGDVVVGLRQLLVLIQGEVIILDSLDELSVGAE